MVLVFLVTGALYIKAGRKAETASIPLPTPNFQHVESKFPNLAVPSNADRTGLVDVSGGQGIGEAFRAFSNGEFSLTVAVDLPVLKTGYFYETWLVRGLAEDDNFAFVSGGRMNVTKGGYLSEFSGKRDYSDYKKIVVTLEKFPDNTPETHILEGSF